MSKISQDLIALLNLDASGSHLDFMNKLERYMSLWLNNAITDPNLRAFIRLTLINECTEYFGMKKAVAELHISDKVRETYLARLAAMEGNPVIRVYHETDVKRNELMWWLTNKLDPPLAEGNYTCQQAWEATVAALKTQVQDTILSGFNERLGDNQEYQQVVAQIIRKMGVERDPNTEQVQLDDGTLIQAIDWVVAKSLWAEMLDRNYATEYANMEGHGAIFATMRPNGYFGYRASGSATSNAIQQFNRTEVYQSKGDYVNAALAMPHFQGVILLFLAAAYPFFAMAMLLPGRAGAVMLWMGLWAWAKLWDVGFAVVMMIDNILFALFPRGPNLAEGELKDAGKAWTRILETDPSYSAQVYYNLLATCLFAVPI
ncbi:MAG TPA: hypothetical protein PLP17_16200, partial [Oligoflexia bacterium]|nr:hypothetical protein [Oligoflexia bacterium]